MLRTVDRTIARTGGLCAEYRPAALAKLDGRTKEARLIRTLRVALIAHCGGKPSTTQAALIERAIMLQLRLSLLDHKFAERGEMTDYDSRTYLAWSNALTRLLRQLGLKGARAAGPTLGEHLAQRASAAEMAPANVAAP